jgi:hypothetical protein
MADALCTGLEAKGIHCWIAPRDLELGQPYAEGCVLGIEASSSFVLLASKSAISSTQVLSEVEQAHKRRKPIYTILVGKPQVTKELDFYISRLHWIESAGNSVEDLVSRLSMVLSGNEPWSDIASPPSLRRTVLYRRDSFVGATFGTLLALVLAGGGLAFWISSQVGKLDHDYRRLGYISLSAERATSSAENEPVIQLQAQVWLLAKSVPFRDVTFVSVADRPDGPIDRSEHTSLFNPEQVGSVELVRFPVSLATKRLATCLGVPNPGLRERSRVTQMFSLSTNAGGTNDPVTLVPIGEPTVTRDDGSPCNLPNTLER